MKNYFLAERMKYRHTFLNGTAVMLPLVCTLLAAVLTHSFFAVDSYNWWYMALCPGMIGIVCGMIGGKERRKKNHTILPLPCSMGKIWDAKVLLGAALSAISIACAVIFTLAGGMLLKNVLHVHFIVEPSVKMQLAAGLLIWLTTLWQIPFCLLLSQKMGTFVMFLVHVLTCSVVSFTVSLKPWFAFLPGAITSRLMCQVLGVLPNGLPAVQGQMTYSAGFMGVWNFLIGIPAALFWFALLWLLGRKWFERKAAV